MPSEQASQRNKLDLEGLENRNLGENVAGNSAA